MSKVIFRIAAQTDKAGRSGNEDNFWVNDNLGETAERPLFVRDKEITLHASGAVLVVCDGMGGMNAGEVASAIAVDTIREWFLPAKITPAVTASPESIKQYIKKAIVAADGNIKRDGTTNADHAGMGSTIVMAWLVGNSVYVGWCGDSRAYCFNPADGLRQLSHDHSFVQELVDAGKITADLAFEHPNNNIITRSLGEPNKTAHPDVAHYPLRNGDVLMLCSDGLCGLLRDSEMEPIMRSSAAGMGDLLGALWGAGEREGWHDNATIVLCQIVDGAASLAAPASASAATSAADKAPAPFGASTWKRKRKRYNGTLAVVVGLLLLAVAYIAAGVWQGGFNPTEWGKSYPYPYPDTIVDDDGQSYIEIHHSKDSVERLPLKSASEKPSAPARAPQKATPSPAKTAPQSTEQPQPLPDTAEDTVAVPTPAPAVAPAAPAKSGLTPAAAPRGADTPFGAAAQGAAAPAAAKPTPAPAPASKKDAKKDSRKGKK
jgi:serine/threonine protein phosphatase PrpC